MKIVMLDGYTLNPAGDNPWDSIAALGNLTVYDRTPSGQIIERLSGAEVGLTNKTPISSETLASLSDLRYISVTATGYNIVDVEAARDRNIPVSNIPVYGTASVAQYTMALLLELCHYVARHDAAVRQGRWQSSGDWSFQETPQIELVGKTLGLVGYGRIGQRVGELAHAFGMEILANVPSRKEPPTYAPFAFCSLEEIFARSDVISLHCPQTTDNTEFVNRSLLKRLKSGAILINTSRGGLIAEADLLEGLRQGHPAAAATDVATIEPIENSNPLLKAPNLLITPHMAWSTLAARKRLTAMTAENVAAYQRGTPMNVVNPSC